MKGIGRRVLLVALGLGLLMVVCSGCTRAKPPRTLELPPGMAAATEDNSPLQSTGDDAVSAAYPEPTVTETAAATLTPTAMSPSPTTAPTDTPVSAPTATPTSPAPTVTVPPTDTPLPTATSLPTAATTATPAAKHDVEHVVAQGETLLSLSRKYGTTVLAIMNRNGLSQPDTIYVGTKLTIPVGYSPSETPPTGTVKHVVQTGETLAQLARNYRTTIKEIIASNPAVAADPNNVKPGTELTITVGTAPVQRTHTVRYGESATGIAWRYRTTVQALVEANGLRNPNQLQAGQVLVIP